MSAATVWLQRNALDLGAVDAGTTRLLQRRLAARSRARLLVGLLARRADARIAAGLPHRVARGERVTAAVVLGRPGHDAALAASVLAVVWCAVLLGTGHAPLAAVLTGWCLVAGTAAALALRQALRRPSVAVDAVSLTIDERLRSQEADAAVRALLVLWLAAGPLEGLADDLPGALRTAFWISFLAVLLLHARALLPRTWPRSGATS